MTEFQTLIFHRVVDATPQAAYHLFTNPLALTNWLCNASEADARPGGRLYLWWDSGYYATGVYTAMEEHHSVAFSWFGRDEPAETDVRVLLTPQREATQITLEHMGVGVDDIWKKTKEELKKGWEIALDNLQSVLETGWDLRFIRRPMLGIVPAGPLDSKTVTKLGLPVAEGILLGAVVSGMGAKAAGLHRDDVLVELAGEPTPDWASLRSVLGNLYAGDEVEVVFFRGSEKRVTTLTLSGRELKEVPDTADSLALELSRLYHEVFLELETILSGTSQEVATCRPQPESWNALEIIAHLIITERETHGWIAAILSDKRYSFDSNLDVWVEAVVSEMPSMPALLQAYRHAQRETIAMVRRLPERFLRDRKGSYIKMGQGLLDSNYHAEVHLRQMREVLEACRKA
jgi:uncharacterized protein YndB with AHSA1/START domain